MCVCVSCIFNQSTYHKSSNVKYIINYRSSFFVAYPPEFVAYQSLLVCEDVKERILEHMAVSFLKGPSSFGGEG